MKTWLLIDAHNTCHRLFYGMPEFSHEGIINTVIFGFLRDIQLLKSRFGTDRFAFCFDLGVPARQIAEPGYKQGRKAKADEEAQNKPERAIARQELYRQIALLRTDYLPELGFRNVFAEEGFEADDLIASVCKQSLQGNRAVIVSTDKDMYQLLGSNVMIFNSLKKTLIDDDFFMQEYGINPGNWPDAKAIAGDLSDSIEGIKGIGEIMASKYLSGRLKETTKAYQKIAADNNRAYSKNIQLVRLPYPGTPKLHLVEDSVTDQKWNAIADRLGMPSLRIEDPFKKTIKQKHQETQIDAEPWRGEEDDALSGA